MCHPEQRVPINERTFAIRPMCAARSTVPGRAVDAEMTRYSPGIRGACKCTGWADFLRMRMLSISTPSEKAIAK
jgi:hypothetical protein